MVDAEDLPEPEGSTTMSAPDDGETTNVMTRWEYTNDVIAGLYLLVFLGLIGLHGWGWIDLSTVPVNWLLVTALIALIDAVWVFGASAAKAAVKLWGK